MKKKSLLILPVLLLALAACNKEDEVEVPEDDGTTPTEPSGDQGTGDGSQAGGDDGEKEPVVDSRIKLYKGELAGYTEGVYFENDSSLKMADPALDKDGNIVYTLSGTASSMSTSQATEFYNGVAECGDAYVIITISLEKDEVLSWVSSDAPSVTNTMTYEECENEGSEDFIIRLSGANPDGTAIKGESYIFTITDANKEEITHTLDFTNVAKYDSRIAVTHGTATLGSEVTYENETNLSVGSKTEDASGITYKLSGTAATMDEYQASDYWSGVATAGDLYFVVTVSLKEGEKVSWTSPAGAKYVEYAYAERTGEEDMVLRISGTSSYSDSSATTVVFTITDSSNGTTTHTVDFSSVAHPAPVREAIETAPCGSLGVLDFSVIDETISSPERTEDQLNTLFADAWVAGSSAEPTNIVPFESEDEQTTLPFSVTGATKVFVGAGGVATSNNTYWQLTSQCIKLSSNSGNGSLTLDFGDTAVSKVVIEALRWSKTENVSLEVAETVSEEDPATLADETNTSVKTVTSAANDLDVTTPEVLCWDLGEGASSITISATKRALIFSITFWAAEE